MYTMGLLSCIVVELSVETTSCLWKLKQQHNTMGPMLRITEIRLPFDHGEDAIRVAICKALAMPAKALIRHTIFRRGVDARKSHAIVFVYTLDIEVTDEARLLARFKNNPHLTIAPDMAYRFAARAPEKPLSARPVIIGMGPAGLFAGLILAQSGFRPIILERGKAVRERAKDTFDFWRKGILDSESNVQFGEGGAGTFSDGKLHSQIKDRKHYGRKVLEELVKAGAPPEIMYVSKPHIGTYKLMGIVEKMRADILALGGEIRFQSRVDDIEIEDGQVRGVVLANGERIATRHLIAAIGHSARDTFEMLHRRGIYIEAKPFSIGFRIEHPQSLIDRGRHGKDAGNPLLGAADYKLVHHASNGRSVYSFCMCPGGTVVASASEAGRVVTNGMSQYSRNEQNANSAIVVGISPEDYPGGPLAGVEFQRFWEARAFELGGGNFNAPGQRVGDFLADRASSAWGSVKPSYTPGVKHCDLCDALPEYAITAIREALPAFAKQIKDFDLPDAVLTAVESRTSSPICIKRSADDFQSINTKGFYPTGEGAGYAGGILSSAVDGITVAEAVALALLAAEPKVEPLDYSSPANATREGEEAM